MILGSVGAHAAATSELAVLGRSAPANLARALVLLAVPRCWYVSSTHGVQRAQRHIDKNKTRICGRPYGRVGAPCVSHILRLPLALPDATSQGPRLFDMHEDMDV